MDIELVRRIAADTAALDNKAAWAALEPLLAAAGAPRRDWMRLRTAAWAERKKQRADLRNTTREHQRTPVNTNGH